MAGWQNQSRTGTVKLAVVKLELLVGGFVPRREFFGRTKCVGGGGIDMCFIYVRNASGTRAGKTCKLKKLILFQYIVMTFIYGSCAMGVMVTGGMVVMGNINAEWPATCHRHLKKWRLTVVASLALVSAI